MTALLPLMAPGLMSDNERMVESGYWMGLTMLWKTLGWGQIVRPGQMREDTQLLDLKTEFLLTK